MSELSLIRGTVETALSRFYEKRETTTWNNIRELQSVLSQILLFDRDVEQWKESDPIFARLFARVRNVYPYIGFDEACCQMLLTELYKLPTVYMNKDSRELTRAIPSDAVASDYQALEPRRALLPAVQIALSRYP